MILRVDYCRRNESYDKININEQIIIKKIKTKITVNFEINKSFEIVKLINKKTILLWTNELNKNSMVFSHKKM